MDVSSQINNSAKNNKINKTMLQKMIHTISMKLKVLCNFLVFKYQLWSHILLLQAQ